MKVKQRKDIGEGHGYHLEGEKWKVNDNDTIKFTGPVSEGLLVIQRESKLVWIQQMASLSITFLPTYIFPSFFSLTAIHILDLVERWHPPKSVRNLWALSRDSIPE